PSSAAAADFTLTVTVERLRNSSAPGDPGISAGRVTSGPAGINCPAKDLTKNIVGGVEVDATKLNPGDLQASVTCSASFPAGTVVTLTPHPWLASQSFQGWFGACIGFGPCVITMNSAKAVRAQFMTDLKTIFSISATVVGPGSVASTLAKIDCGGGAP